MVEHRSARFEAPEAAWGVKDGEVVSPSHQEGFGHGALPSRIFF